MSSSSKSSAGPFLNRPDQLFAAAKGEASAQAVMSRAARRDRMHSIMAQTVRSMKKKLRRWLLYSLGAMLVVLVALIALVPSFIDTPAVRAEIQRRLATALEGEVTGQAVEIGWRSSP